ncbi:MAG: HAD hydrolase-like protein [Desulfomonile tiedjei]|uniref:phosphoglycolate phosphatase n=1 Tax=Desulfomonile tiedjei TaxID=2358 RepID=A0A9D6Z3F5_9BACT|nr:HAD hydrolase-like protein [Desulfomonile tiedjei]
MHALVLFDIDGTLIDSGGAGIAALNQALEDLTGIKDGFNGIDCAGKTDIQIIKEACEKLHLESDNGLIPRFVGRYLTHLKPHVQIRNGGRVKVGIHNLLNGLAQDGNYGLGLLTGNIKEGARLKLEPHSLNEFFSFGAFGDDSEDRNQLLPIAVKRYSELTGKVVDFGRCLVVGDTPRDVACARVHGAQCLAVATGRHSVEDLERAGANLTLSDLSETELVLRRIEQIRLGWDHNIARW